LPPAIALGMEPGSPDIMDDKPRPKTQPIVLPWMWQSIVVNGLILTFVIFLTYLCNLQAYTGAILQDDIASDTKMDCTIWDGQFFNPTKIQCQVPELEGLNGTFFWEPKDQSTRNTYVTCDLSDGNTCTGIEECDAFVDGGLTITPGSCVTVDDFEWACVQCGPEQLIRARTSAFIALVYSENLRAYTARSFDKPIWTAMFANKSMQKAIGGAQLALYIALFVPGLNSSVLELDPYFIGAYGWIMAFIGSLATVTVCEIYKCYLKGVMKKFYDDLDASREAEFANQFGNKVTDEKV